MKGYLFRRFLMSLPVIFGVATLVFFLIHMIPGDPVDLMLGDSAQAMDKEGLRRALGLDLPLLDQYFLFWKNIFSGGWGLSITKQRPVLSLLLERFPATLLLASMALLVSLSISLPLGVWAARKSGTFWDTFATGFALLGMSVPVFVLAPLLILLFSLHWNLLPVSGMGTWRHLVLPAFCLGVGMSGGLTRMVRTAMLETLGEDYIRTARSKGLWERLVLFRHALRNALIPVLTILGNMLGSLLAGSVITETIFDWPGIGRLFFSAFQSRDYPVVQGVVLWTALSYVAINLFVDVMYSVADPRIRVEG